MTLAIQCDQLIRDGVIKNQSELAHYANITTARMTHIMWLTNLAPEIQEAILFLPRVESGSDTVKEIELSNASVPPDHLGGVKYTQRVHSVVRAEQGQRVVGALDPGLASGA